MDKQELTSKIFNFANSDPITQLQTKESLKEAIDEYKDSQKTEESGEA